MVDFSAFVVPMMSIKTPGPFSASAERLEHKKLNFMILLFFSVSTNVVLTTHRSRDFHGKRDQRIAFFVFSLGWSIGASFIKMKIVASFLIQE